jgi:phosphoglucomutase
MEPDGTFPTAPYPNPEKDACWEEALKTAKENDADIIIATDPDGDRVGLYAKHNNEYKKLSGNEVGVCLLEYILSNKKLPENPAVISTIVSSRLSEKISHAHGAKYFDVYTGFKNIAEKMLEFETESNFNFVFGFEESIGYLLGTHARDKDATVASLIICQLAQELKDNGKTYFDYLERIWHKYGRNFETTKELVKEGIKGAEEIDNMMRMFRKNPPEKIAHQKITNVLDYAKTLVPANVVRLTLESGSEVCIRPSGTEPKIKFYFSACSKEELELMIEDLLEVKSYA